MTSSKKTTDQDLMKLAGFKPKNKEEGEEMTAAIRYLRIRAKQFGSNPPVSELKKQLKRIDRAVEALDGLPHPLREFYSGNGTHLLAEAKKLQRRIAKMKGNAGRPAEMGKLWLIMDCISVVTSFGGSASPLRIDGIPDGYEVVLGGGTNKPTSSIVSFAKTVWEAEGLPTSELKNWLALVQKHWASFFRGDDFYGAVSWRETLKDLEIEWVADPANEKQS